MSGYGGKSDKAEREEIEQKKAASVSGGRPGFKHDAFGRFQARYCAHRHPILLFSARSSELRRYAF